MTDTGSDFPQRKREDLIVLLKDVPYKQADVGVPLA
jgi:hypothetical protein